MKMKIYVVYYNTESGDDGVVGYFNQKPTDGHLTAFFKELMPDEFIKDEGDDEERPLVFWEVHELSAIKLPKPVTPIRSI